MAKCSGSIAIIEVSDGLTTFYQYAYNTSGTTAPTSGWCQSVPASAAGRFVWRREGTALSYDDITSWGNEVCLTGATGATGAAGNGISSIVEYYAVSASNSTAPSSWSTSMPTLTATNKYLWNYTRYTYTDGTYVDTTKIVIGTYGDKGDTGSTGDVGQGVDSITEEYYLSTSKATQTGGSWVASPPTWSTGKYLWTRSKIAYKNPADTKYTTPVCDSSWEAVNEVSVGGRNLLTPTLNSGGNTTVDNTTAEGGTVTLGTAGTDTYFYINCHNPLVAGEQYTVSCIATGVPDGTDWVFPIQAQSNTYKLHVNKNGKLSLTFIANGSYNLSKIIFDDITGRITSGGITLTSFKLEKGNVATDWTPAPEDLEGIVDKSIKTSDVEYYLSTSSTALSGGSWLTTAPQWVDGKFMWTRTKTTLNDGTVSYSPSSGGTCIAGAKGATGPKGDTGETGAAAKSVSISAPDLFWHFTGRGALTDAAQAITLTANAVNFTPSAYQWQRDGTAISGATSTTYSVPSMATGTYKVVVDGTYEASLIVGSVTDGASEGIYLGILTIPADASSWETAYGGYKVPSGTFEGQNLIAGDYYVYNNSGTVTNYYFNGTAFEVASGDKLSLFINAFWDVLNLGTTQASGSFYTLYAKYFMAMEAVIVSLGASQIHIQTLNGESGCIYGGSYNADGTCSDTSEAGFWLGANGHFLLNNGTIESNYTEWADGDPADDEGYTGVSGEPKTGFKLDGTDSIIKAAYGVLGKKFTLYGTLWNAVLKTRLSKTGSLITIPDKSHWLADDVQSFIDGLSIASNSFVPASGTYDGQTVAYVLKATRTNVRLITAQSNNADGANATITMPCSGTVYTYAKGYYDTFNLNGITYTPQSDAYVSQNGTQVIFSESGTAYSKTVTAAKDDVFYAYIEAGFGTCIAYADLVLDSAGYYLILADGTLVHITGYSDKSLSLTISESTWDSASNLNYVPGSSIISLVATQVNQGVLSGCSGTVVIAGTSRSLTNILYQLTSVLLYWSSTEYQTIAAGGYYDISGSFTPESQTAAVLTANLLPLVDADDSGNGNDVGTSSKPYRNGYFRQINADTVNGNVNEQGTANKVWGAVAN